MQSGSQAVIWLDEVVVVVVKRESSSGWMLCDGGERASWPGIIETNVSPAVTIHFSHMQRIEPHRGQLEWQ